MHQFIIPGWLFTLGSAPILTLALWKGGWRERAIAIALGVEIVLETDLFHWRLSAGETLVLDLSILVVCLLTALRSERYWTIAASSFALLSVITPAFRLARGVSNWAYLSLERLWYLFLLGALCAGLYALLRPPPPAAANEA